VRVVWIAAVLAGLGLGTYAAFEEREYREDAIPEELARRAMAREIEVAESIGFVGGEESVHELPESDQASFPIAIAADECVAAVGAYWGAQRVRRFAIATWCDDVRDSRLSEQSTIHGAALHVQWCSPVATELRVCVQSRPTIGWYGQESGRPLALRILRAPAAVVRGRENRGFALR
jgi:hypothetical protein